MAGLGEGMENGEPGMVTGTPQIDVQAIPSKKGEISHTTAVEDISFLLYRDYIFLAEYTIDTTMLPGHVFAIIPIHPSACNPYVEYFSKPFNAWNGTMGIRTRFMANAFNGGSFRIGWLPPNLNPTEIRTMPLSSLTAYPNRDLDPKNTDWMHYMANDERNVMFHWMTDGPDYTKPESFGGYIVMYVVGSLVTGQAQIGTVSMVVEAVGNFTFKQPSPRFKNISPVSNGPLSQDAITDITYAMGCDDFFASPRQAINILPKMLEALHWGFSRAYTVGGQPSYSSPGAALDDVERDVMNQNISIQTNTVATYNITAENYCEFRIPKRTNTCLPFNIDRRAVQFSTSLFAAGASGVTFYDQTVTKAEIHVESDNWQRYTCGPFQSAGTSPGFASFWGETGGTFNGEYIGAKDTTSLLPKPQPAESAVVFSALISASANAQTRPMAQSLKNSTANPGMSYLYAVHSQQNPERLRLLRLNPNGMFTTQAEDNNVTLRPALGDSFYLTYEGTLPVDSPLPPRSSYAKQIARRSVKALARSPDGSTLSKVY